MQAPCSEMWGLFKEESDFGSLFSEKLQFSLRFISTTVAEIIQRKDLISKWTFLRVVVTNSCVTCISAELGRVVWP